MADMAKWSSRRGVTHNDNNNNNNNNNSALNDIIAHDFASVGFPVSKK